MKFALILDNLKCPDAEISVGQYADGSTAWNVYGDCGEGFPECIGAATVCLPRRPPEGHVFVRCAGEQRGWLDSLTRANIVEDTGERVRSGWVDEYAALCRVKFSELIP